MEETLSTLLGGNGNMDDDTWGTDSGCTLGKDLWCNGTSEMWKTLWSG